MKDGKVNDATRIKAHLPTIRYLLERNAKTILMSHLGRPDGKVNLKYSLEPVAAELQTLLGGSTEVVFAADCLNEANRDMVARLKNNQVLLLENLRFYAEEENNDAEFAKQLADLGDVYVNDAFGTAHRAHASTFGVTQFFSKDHVCAGLLLQREIEAMAPILDSPTRLFVAILGGAKVSDKIKVIESFMQRSDTILIGGAMAFTFLKAKGSPVGMSLVENDFVDLAARLMSSAQARNVRLLLPVDHVVTDDLKSPKVVKTVDAIPADLQGVDIGPKTLELFSQAMQSAKTVVWNGPMGVFETAAFSRGTIGIAEQLAALTKGGAVTIVGGGDSVAAANVAGVSQILTHVSTGGGATLEFFEGRGLPGIEPLLR
jgi:phosphoglycerate kinase